MNKSANPLGCNLFLTEIKTAKFNLDINKSISRHQDTISIELMKNLAEHIQKCLHVLSNPSASKAIFPQLSKICPRVTIIK